MQTDAAQVISLLEPRRVADRFAEVNAHAARMAPAEGGYSIKIK